MAARLYYYPGNANLAPHILLREAGLEVELVRVDRASGAQKSEEYLRLNPNGRIPTFVTGELVLFEAAAICLHIADHAPQARLIPPLGSSARSEFYKWLVFLTNTVQPAYMAFRYPEQHTDDAAGVEGVRRSAAERARRAFRVLEEALGGGPFLLGSAYTACDAYLFMLAWWGMKLPDPPARWPRLRRLVEAVLERPGTRAACAAEGLTISL
jgi:glutathione S-transferase